MAKRDHNQFDSSRREFLTTATAAFTALAGEADAKSGLVAARQSSSSNGDWPMLRQDRMMLGYQPLAGAMQRAPRVLAKHFLGAGQGATVLADLRGTGQKQDVLVLARARLTAYDADGHLLWQSASEGSVLEGVQWVEDLDGDGHNEVVAIAGMMGGPRQAYLILDGRTGKQRATIPFIIGDFGYQGHCGAYLPGVQGKQIFLLTSTLQAESGPFRSNGQFSLWQFDGEKAVQKWAWTPKEYALLYAVALFGDLNGDGRLHAVVNSWANIWDIDLATGDYTHTTWDTQGTNHRHYGWNQLIDLNGDGKLDYICVPITKRVDVLLNTGGKLQHAWTHGWPDSVTTEARELAWPGDPVADLDGDGKLEVCAALFDGLTDKRWHLFVWDAVTGTQKAEELDLIPIATAPLWGPKGGQALLCARSGQRGYNPPARYEIWRMREGQMEKIWSAADVVPLLEAILESETLVPNTTGTSVRRLQQTDVDGDGCAEFFTLANQERGKRAEGREKAAQAWGVDASGQMVAKNGQPPVPKPPPALPAHLPALSGVTVPYLLAADVDGDGHTETLLYDTSTLTISRLEGKGLRVLETLPSSEVPIVCDLLGDGSPYLLTAGRGEDGNLWVQARDKHRQTLWRYVFPRSSACGQYSVRPHYFTVGRFTGRQGMDVFTYSTKPEARSYVLDGRTGQPVWEQRDVPKIERSLQPFGGRAVAWDYNGDGAEDILLCNPDYYCVVDGKTGDLLVGPVFLAHLTTLWAAYSTPLVLPRASKPPIVYLAGAYSARLGINLNGSQCLWHEYLPSERWSLGAYQHVAEGLLPPAGGRDWRVGQVEADGTLVCFEAATGKKVWTLALPTAPSAMISGDIDGDGAAELLFGGKDGALYAVRDAGSHGQIIWRKKFAGPVETPLLADVNNDGKSEIVVSVGDGFVYVLG